MRLRISARRLNASFVCAVLQRILIAFWRTRPLGAIVIDIAFSRLR